MTLSLLMFVLMITTLTALVGVLVADAVRALRRVPVRRDVQAGATRGRLRPASR